MIAHKDWFKDDDKTPELTTGEPFPVLQEPVPQLGETPPQLAEPTPSIGNNIDTSEEDDLGLGLGLGDPLPKNEPGEETHLGLGDPIPEPKPSSEKQTEPEPMVLGLGEPFPQLGGSPNNGPTLDLEDDWGLSSYETTPVTETKPEPLPELNKPANFNEPAKEKSEAPLPELTPDSTNASGNEASQTAAEDPAAVEKPLTMPEFMKKLMEEKAKNRNLPPESQFIRNQKEDASRLGRFYWGLQGYAAFNAGAHFLQRVEIAGSNPPITEVYNILLSTTATAAVAFAGIHLITRLKQKVDIHRINRAVKTAANLERRGIPENPARGKWMWPLILLGAPAAGMHVAVKMHEVLSTNIPTPLIREICNPTGFLPSLKKVCNTGMQIIQSNSGFAEHTLVAGAIAGAGAGLLLAIKITKHSRMHGILGVTREWTRAAVRKAERLRKPIDNKDDALRNPTNIPAI